MASASEALRALLPMALKPLYSCTLVRIYLARALRLGVRLSLPGDALGERYLLRRPAVVSLDKRTRVQGFDGTLLPRGEPIELLYSGQIYLASPLRLCVRDLCEGLGADALLAVEVAELADGRRKIFLEFCVSAFSVLESDLGLDY